MEWGCRGRTREGGAGGAARWVVLGGSSGQRAGRAAPLLPLLLRVPEEGTQGKHFSVPQFPPPRGDAALRPHRAAVRRNKIGVLEALGAPRCCVLGKASPQ